MDHSTEVRLRVSMDEAHALRRLLRGQPARRGDDALLDRVGMHVGAVLGTLATMPPLTREQRNAV